MIARYEQDDRKCQLCPICHRIEPVQIDIALHLERKGLGDRFAAHMYIVVEPPLLDQLIFIFILKYMDRSAGQIVNSFHTQHKIKAGCRIQSFI